MIHVRFLVSVFTIYYFFDCNAFKSESKQPKFEVILNDVYICSNPQPAYTNSRRIKPNYTTKVVNGKRYLTGYTIVSSPTPFKNFSARTYFVNNTNRVVKMEIVGVSCKNVFARAIILYSNITVTQKNCMVKQGRYQYDNMDINKISHALPNWHAPGEIVHQLQLVSNGATEFCEEISVTIKYSH